MQFIYANLKSEYTSLWRTVKLDASVEPVLLSTAKKILSFKSRYEEVSRATGVPWWWIGIVHSLEAGLSFNGHLHNGDSLKARTVQVPAGRPTAGSPPFTWLVSAIDALVFKGLQNIKSWPIERCLYEWERYNGFGYRQYHPREKTPYLWSKTNHNDGTGKYVADGKWSEGAFSESQCGAAALLMTLMKLDPSVKVGDEFSENTEAVIKILTPTVGTTAVVVAQQAGYDWMQIGVALGIAAASIAFILLVLNKRKRK